MDNNVVGPQLGVTKAVIKSVVPDRGVIYLF